MDSASTPLADYFWIAGVESISYDDTLASLPQFDDTIDENSELDAVVADTARNTSSSRVSTARHFRQSSANRLSKLSLDGRLSLHTLEDFDGNTQSNRSSTTIKPTCFNRSLPMGPDSARSDITSAMFANDTPSSIQFDSDFDQLLSKFALERENFLQDLSFSAGAKLHAPPPMVSPRTGKLNPDENDVDIIGGHRSPLRSIKGSIRRKLSFRDMNSMRKPINSVGRTVSEWTSRRVSCYNSVIPPPEPLNTEPDMHPLKRRFEPVLLDRYPPRSAPDENFRRGKFPDFVPMFAFPNDIQIVSSDDRPRSTWHGFTMTAEDNAKVYGVVAIIWIALEPDIADEVEKRCKLWRQNHMSDEERELAVSLGVRLAAERANLSQLLAQLPMVLSGSATREALDEQIGMVEEKIGLMTELLRPLRHGAAYKIEGLTAGETGLWAPRAYGILGRDATLMPFYKEWLRAVIVPMGDGAVLRVPASSPRVGRWQPLERYVVNLCMEAFSPLGSKTQVELGVRELRLYARQEAPNEIPGSRNTDIYALFRCLSLENIIQLVEYALQEARIIFLSSHPAMLHLACHALVSLIYPLQWASIFIPILPARLLSVLEAPCPYIVGVERRYERIDLPEDDFILVDLDRDVVDAVSLQVTLPRQFRRKLLSLLQASAPHRLRYGIPAGPPPYAVEAFPYDAFSAENESLFNPIPPPATLGKWVSQSSATFTEANPVTQRLPIFNAFLQLRHDFTRVERPPTSWSMKSNSPPTSFSQISTNFPPPPMAPTSVSRSDSEFAVSAMLREKRPGHLNEKTRRSSSFNIDREHNLHRPSLQYLSGLGQNISSHGQSMSVSAISIDSRSSYGGGTYAPSTYAQSTLASTVMPTMVMQPVSSTETMTLVEGHCFVWVSGDSTDTCVICDERSDGEGLYQCLGCPSLAHIRCLGRVSIVCPQAFHADRVRAAFVRCMASLLYTYRKYLGRPTKEQKANGQMYAFDAESYARSLPHDQQDYVMMLKNTQAFNQFIHERETRSPADPSIKLFDDIILAKKARGRSGLGTLGGSLAGGLGGGLTRLSAIKASHGLSARSSNKSRQAVRIPPHLADTSEHIWRTASVPAPSSHFPGEYRAVTTRVPSKLDTSLIKEPRTIQGMPRPDQRGSRSLVRKQVASMLGLETPTRVAF